MALSGLAARKAKATGKNYTLTDVDGLSLAVSAQGGKSWHFRYYRLDRQKRMSLGTYPEVPPERPAGQRYGLGLVSTEPVRPPRLPQVLCAA